MKELRRKVTDLKWEELKMANKEFPMFNSDHEAFGVLAEEKDEAIEEAVNIINAFDDFKYAVFHDDVKMKKESIDRIEKYAVEAACEFIQVAAMARKWKVGKTKEMPDFEIPSFLKEYTSSINQNDIHKITLYCKQEGEKNE